MGHVSVRYDNATGQPYVIRVAEEDNVPPLEPMPGEKVAISTVENYRGKSHKEFLRGLNAKIAQFINQADEAEAARLAAGSDQDPESQAIGTARAAAQASGDLEALAELDRMSEELAASQTPPPDEIS